MKNPFDTITNPSKFQILILEERLKVINEHIKEQEDRKYLIECEIKKLKEKL